MAALLDMSRPVRILAPWLDSGEIAYRSILLHEYINPMTHWHLLILNRMTGRYTPDSTVFSLVALRGGGGNITVNYKLHLLCRQDYNRCDT